ncbi:hypothetical protein ACHAXM_006117 [Skeletonema potamos]
MTYSSNVNIFTPIRGAAHDDPHTEAIRAEIARKLQSKEWQENAAKNNIFSDCEEPTYPRRNVSAAPIPIRKFTTLNLGKRQRNS